MLTGRDIEALRAFQRGSRATGPRRLQANPCQGFVFFDPLGVAARRCEAMGESLGRMGRLRGRMASAWIDGATAALCWQSRLLWPRLFS